MYSVWKNTCFPLIGYLLINIIHGLYYIYLLVYSVYCSFLRRTRLLYHEITLQSRNTHTYGNKDVKFLSKLPKHLAIIIGAENIFYKDLVKLILWCSQFGVKFISFYQKNNNIQPHLLYETFYKYNKESVRKVVWNKSFEHLKEQVKQDLNGYTMCDPSEQLHVNIFRTNDGLDYLVEMTKDLSKLPSYSSSPSPPPRSGDITQELINDLIFKKINVPDPDVALVFGDTCSSFGFLPWHLRVTEFVHFHSHHKITSRDFIVLLEKYSNCEQRFGK